MNIKDIIELLTGANRKEREQAKTEGRSAKRIMLRAGTQIVASDRVYMVTYKGPWVRVIPERPYRGKAGRRAHIKQRRLDKVGEALACQE